MRVRLLAAAAMAAAPLFMTPAAQATPYCVDVTDNGDTIVSACVVGDNCAVYGGTDTLFLCIRWP